MLTWLTDPVHQFLFQLRPLSCGQAERAASAGQSERKMLLLEVARWARAAGKAARKGLPAPHAAPAVRKWAQEQAAQPGSDWRAAEMEALGMSCRAAKREAQRQRLALRLLAERSDQ